MKRQKKRCVRANGRAQEHDGAVNAVVCLLIERREPQPTRLGALGSKVPRAANQREKQRRGYCARSNRKLSRSDRAMI